MPVERVPCRRGDGASRRPRQKGRAELRFQDIQVLTHRRLCDAEKLGCAGYSARIDDLHENFEATCVHDRTIYPARKFIFKRTARAQSAAATTAPCTDGRRTRKHSGMSAKQSHPDK